MFEHLCNVKKNSNITKPAKKLTKNLKQTESLLNAIYGF